MNILLTSKYGSHLYGTNTPESDVDNKAIYLPELSDLLLGYKSGVKKVRVDANGVKVPDGESMPAGGVETEYLPLQQFARDFVNGQTWALELVYACIGGAADCTPDMKTFIEELKEKFSNANVYSMVGFAQKQTFDYVKRGERLNEARKVMKAIADARLEGQLTLAKADMGGEPRLDTLVRGKPILDMIAEQANVAIGSSENNGKTLRTLELNGRSYLETSGLEHLSRTITKLIDGYGDRVHDAAKNSVDYKSIMHAIRVYQQAIELLDTGTITFPRHNAPYLLSVKQGKQDLKEIKELLVNLDEEVNQKIDSSIMRKSTPELIEASEAWLVGQLWKLYDLRASA